MIKKIFYLLIVLLGGMPTIVSAEIVWVPTFSSPTIWNFFAFLEVAIPRVLIILIGILILVYIWHLVLFIGRADNDEARQKGKKILLWGIIILFCVFSLWGLVAFLQKAFFGNRLIPRSLPPPQISFPWEWE